MRLDAKDMAIIKKILHDSITDAKIYLFGSRVDDSKKGGDIDLFVQTNRPVSLKEELSILVEMEKLGIERKVDLIIDAPNKKVQPIFKTILSEGIRL